MSDGGTTLKEQFLIEGRDLVETAGECLLKLEKEPDDQALVAALFRAVHTLKGNSGLFPVGPLTRVVHAAEDVLDEVRAGALALDSAMADVLLDALDQVSGWLDGFDGQDRLPDEADEVATRLAARLAKFRSKGETAPAPQEMPSGPAADWLDDLPAADRAAAQAACASGDAVVLIDYRPDGGCFFRGEDPLRFMLTLPGLAWLSITPTEPLLPGPQFDPFLSVLRFRAISTADEADVRTHLAYVAEQVAVGARAAPRRSQTMTPMLRSLLESTIEAISCDGPPEIFAGRMGSTAAVLAALLPPAGLCSEAEVIAARDLALAAGKAAPLLQLVSAALAKSAALAVPPASPGGTDAVQNPSAKDEPRNALPRRSGPLKVDQARIDMLMKLAGELIVAKNGLPFLAARAEEVYGSRAMAREIRSHFDVFNRLVGELQTTVLQVRMVPLGAVFERFRRLVRDLSRQVDKPLNFIIEGEETEADKNVVEDLGEPLIHLIRNAVDHGLEPAADRIAAGKPPVGEVRLTARLSEDKVVITVADDGRGIDIARVRAKAVERGLLSSSEAASLPEEAALRMVLQPGFSTATSISSLSGRGVGMDVVATMVERSGGTLGLRSQSGIGTTVVITLPLTMTMRRMMMVDLAGNQYGVPLERVLETIHVPQDEVHRHLGPLQIVRRDRVIPLCDLRRHLRLEPRMSDGTGLSVLVVTTGLGSIGLIVDAFRSSTDVMPQPLDGPLSGLGCLSGAALLGDGSILMILDVDEVLKCPW